jgi:hypothetical protein
VREDWTFFPARTFCRDVAAERVEEVIIISTNSVPENNYKIESPSSEGPPPTWGPRMFVSDMGCARWEGSIESVAQGEGWQMTTSVDDLVLVRDPSQVFPFRAPYGVNYIPISGTMDWTYTGSLGDCTVNGKELGLALVQQHSFLTIIDVLEGPFARAATGSFYPQQTFLPYTQSCPGNPPENLDWAAGVSFPLTAEAFKVEDGSVIADSMHHDESNTDVTWHFERVRE